MVTSRSLEKSIVASLHPSVKNAYISRFGPLSDVQLLAIPSVLEGKHVLLIAPTGTGKTEAAMLPVFSKLLEIQDRNGISIVYITPLRALNRDMLARLDWWSERLGFSISVRHGDTSKSERRRQTLSPPDLLITTPETLQAMLMGRRLRENLQSVKFVVVDEIHDLASSKRGAQLSLGLERLSALVGEFQRIGLSATVGSPQEMGRFLVGNERAVSVLEVPAASTSNFVVTTPEITQADLTTAKLRQIAPELISHVRILRGIVDAHKSTLIFVNTRQAAEALGSLFRATDVGVHHGSLSKEARIEAENEFKAGIKKGLICTSSMELGIDIGDVEHVVQYNSPREVTRLLQRVGRAGHRIGETSEGTIITTHIDDIMESWVITRRARQNKIEPVSVNYQALDVLANQLCFLVLNGAVPAKRAVGIVKKAYPYRNLALDKFAETVKLLQQQWLLKIGGAEKEPILKKMGKTRRYCYENLSMIPDEKTYGIYDTIDGKWIGTLDETFVVAFAEPGAVFVTKGEMWRILDVDEERIKVEPIERSTGEIPSWTGEQIPVPFDVAIDVGKLREQIAQESSETASSRLLREYHTDPQSVRCVVDLLKRQKEFAVPTDKRLVVEVDAKTALIHACFGHKVNETLGRIITSLLAARLGASVALEVNPYWIQLELPNIVSAEQIAQLVRQVRPEFVKPLIEMTLKNSMLLKWKIVHIARKFGVIERDVEHKHLNVNKLTDLLKDTAVYEEAIHDIAHTKLDFERTSDVLRQIQDGEIKVLTSKLSPLSKERHYGTRELLVTDNPDRSILMALKNRISNDRVILFCLTCKKWKSKRSVARVPEQPQCPLCNSKLIAALKPWEDEEIVIVMKSEAAKTTEEKARTKRVYRNANLVLSHGKKGVIALASRGLGPEAASKVIRKSRVDEEGFYRDILRHERHYTRTRRFWHN